MKPPDDSRRPVSDAETARRPSEAYEFVSGRPTLAGRIGLKRQQKLKSLRRNSKLAVSKKELYAYSAYPA
jgi:hypothetical protein